jgi:hypothetical protein
VATKVSLVDLSSVSKPMTKLIESVSAAIGVIYEPTRVSRKARADAEAIIILGSADAELRDILHRAGERLAYQEARRQQNIEAVIDRAAALLPEEVSSEPINSDWTARLFEGVQDVSNEQLRDYWAKLLAQELTTPGSCSFRTLSILKDMSPADASIFQRVCNLALRSDGSAMVATPLDWSFSSMRWNVAYSDLMVLDSLGLVHLMTDVVEPILPTTKLQYGGGQFQVDLRGQERVEIEIVPFTAAGVELLQVCGCEADLLYFEELEEFLAAKYDVLLAQTGGAI